MRHLPVFRRHALPGQSLCKNTVHRVENGRRRAKRHVEIHFPKVDSLVFLGQKILPHPFKFMRIRSLKRINRLLAVAHHKHGAVFVLGAAAVKKFVGNRADDSPLVGRGILRLVNQNIVNTAVELIQHPVRHLRIFKQAPRIDNQILVIGLGMQAFVFLIPLQQLVGQIQHRPRRGKNAQRRQLVVKLQTAQRFAAGPDVAVRIFLYHRLGRKTFAGFIFSGQKEIAVCGIIFGFISRRQRLRLFPVGFRTGLHGLGQRLQSVLFRRGKKRRPGRLFRFDIVDTEPPGDFVDQSLNRRRLFQNLQNLVAVLSQRVHQLRKRKFAHLRRHIGQRLRRPAFRLGFELQKQTAFNIVHRLGGGAIVHNLKIRRYFGFQRKPLEHFLTKAVNRLYLHSTGSVQQNRKKFARLRRQLRRLVPVQLRGAEQLLELLIKFFIFRHRPFRQLVGNPRAHVDRRRLGISQTQNPSRQHPFEQQTQHPIRQHLGFAGAGRSLHPDRNVGIGGPPLLGGRQSIAALFFLLKRH